MLSAIIEPLKEWATGVIGAWGYPGIFFLMFLDNANVPIPSEAIMPVGGILASKGEMNFHLVALSGSLGSVVGSSLTYWIGALLGKDFLLKYGKWIFIRPKEIEIGDRWFDKYGLPFTFWARFVPLLRTFVSLPAGLYKANFKVFILYAFLGSTPWCYLWTYVGFNLDQYWDQINRSMKYVELAVILVLLYLIVRFIIYRVRTKSNNIEKEASAS